MTWQGSKVELRWFQSPEYVFFFLMSPYMLCVYAQSVLKKTWFAVFLCIKQADTKSACFEWFCAIKLHKRQNGIPSTRHCFEMRGRCSSLHFNAFLPPSFLLCRLFVHTLDLSVLTTPLSNLSPFSVLTLVSWSWIILRPELLIFREIFNDEFSNQNAFSSFCDYYCLQYNLNDKSALSDALL